AMASVRKKQVEEEPAEPEPEEEEEGEQEEEELEAEEEDEPEAEPEPRPRRTAKTRAPKRSATAPVPRQRAARREAPRRRDPRQPSLFSRLGQERISGTATRTVGSILLSLLALIGLIVLFYLFAGSRFFALKGVDVVWLEAQSGIAPLLDAKEVEEIVRSTVLRGVLKADLEQVREKLKENLLIREAEVARLLPDRLRVIIVERRPVALARRGNLVVCVDDDGVMFGDRTLHWRGGDAPLLNGLAEDGEDAKKKNRHWITLYKKLIAELDQTEPPLSSHVDEIFFDEDDGVRLMLTEKRGGVLVGTEDFRTRLNVALDILAAISRKDLDALNVLRIGDAERLLSGKINYVNVNDPKRPVVGLDE
ncbi:MAG: cell division protein FtsQ/DivIB, partial [Blastocatellia bacterium]